MQLNTELPNFNHAYSHALNPPCARAQAPEVLLSPEKRSPEEYKDRSDMAYTTAVDVWAIGVLACELLTGSAPFACKTRLETMDNILRGQLVVPAGVPLKAADFIQAALCKVSWGPLP